MNKRKLPALILTLMMVCSFVPYPGNLLAADGGNAVIPVPEKVRIDQTSRGAVQFDYDSVLPGAVNRSAFIEAVLDMQEPYLLLILAGGHWYNVNGITLADAIEQDKIVEVPEESVDLAFDAGAYEILNVTVDGRPAEVRKYTVTYVANPIEMAEEQPNYGPSGAMGTVTLNDVYSYQKMNIYVPQTAYNNTETAIILGVSNGGWRTSSVGESVVDGGAYVSGSNTDATGAALAAGYVVVNAGTRSRGALGADGSWAGKAPAVVVDAKAAIRYLRLNDSKMPGSAEKIIITGGSGGGGLSVAVAASGNSPDYYPYLREIGAAGFDANGNSTLKDDVYATVAYCPITDLGNADIAYEWQYGFLRTAANGTPADQIAASAELAARYPAYVASLGLKTETGAPLTAEGLKEAIIDFAKRDIEEAIAGETAGVDIPALGGSFVFSGRGGDVEIENDWLNVQGGEITFFDYDKYLTFVSKASALKGVPSFDSTAVTGTTVLSGENSLFGSKDIEYANFAKWSWDNNQIPGDGSGPDDTGKTWDQYIAGSELAQQIKMVNPLPYLGTNDADAAPFWYVRHGMRDRDTSFAVELLLYYGIYNDSAVRDLNFELAWLQPHGGNYDIQEAYAWIADILDGQADEKEVSLDFDAGAYETLNVTVDGRPAEVRKYTVTYVAKPIEMQEQASGGGGFPGGGTPAPFDPYGYQKMNLYVPEIAYNNTETAVILNVNNGGWMTSAVGESVVDGGAYVSGSNTDATGAALAAGYVVVNAGTRSRGALGADGSWPGKAPAVVVDAKAAIRYLRLNDAEIPGSSEKIIITGTSGGGGLSVAVAASGNSPDYYPYLREIGAAGFDANGNSTLKDDVYATVAYCPITDLGNADIAYEWQYGFLRTAANGTPADQIAASAELAARYPAYVASLGLKTETGAPLTAEGIKEAIIDFAKRDIEEAIAGETAGVDIPALGGNFTFPGFSFGDFVVPDTVVENDWLDVQNGEITFFDYDKYLTFVSKASALKGTPAFDSFVTGVTAQSENSLFGSKDIEYANFTKWSWDNNQIPGDGIGLDDTGKTWDEYIAGSELEQQIKMVNPLPYLGQDDADAAPFWYVRHGMRDRDTSFAVELLLYYGILNDQSVEDLNFELAWLEGHGGNYDVQEAYAWVSDILK